MIYPKDFAAFNFLGVNFLGAIGDNALKFSLYQGLPDGKNWWKSLLNTCWLYLTPFQRFCATDARCNTAKNFQSSSYITIYFTILCSRKITSNYGEKAKHLSIFVIYKHKSSLAIFLLILCES